MEPQIWSKSEEKWAYIFMLRGHEVYRLKVTGISLTLKRKVQGVLEALQQGQEPSAAGAKSVETLDARTISKAEVSPGNSSLTLHGTGEGAQSLRFTTADDNADEILQAVLVQSGRTFQPTQEEIGVFEALIPPVVVGALGGLLWVGLRDAAGKIAAGEELEVKGVRRRGLQQIMITAAEILGPNGTIALGVVLGVAVLGWAVLRVVRRPERTVWLPAEA